MSFCSFQQEQSHTWQLYSHSLLSHINSLKHQSLPLLMHCFVLVLALPAISGSPHSVLPDTKEHHMCPGDVSRWAASCRLWDSISGEREKWGSKVSFTLMAWNIHITICTRWSQYSHFLRLMWNKLLCTDYIQYKAHLCYILYSLNVNLLPQDHVSIFTTLLFHYISEENMVLLI